MAFPFLLLVVILLPALVYFTSRQRAVPPTEWPPPSAIYAQVIVLQSLIAATALLADYGADLEIRWGGKLTLLGAALAIGIVACILALSFVGERGRSAEPSIGEALSPRKRTDWVLWAFSLAAAAGGEEYAYRGVLFALAERFVESWYFGATLTAIVFGLSHRAQGWIGVWASAVFGFVMQVLVAETGGLAVAILTHLTYDVAIEFVTRRRAA